MQQINDITITLMCNTRGLISCCCGQVRAEFRRILMEMGFAEMPTNKWVESSFWNFDSLFQPQSHPARDAHDTFFMKVCGQTKHEQ